MRITVEGFVHYEVRAMTLWGRETFCSRVGVKAAGSGAPEARIHNHARYMHGKDRNMRQCEMVLAAGARGRISIVAK